ncbi:hypothetical protein FGRA07_11123 [Fusarium graminearum]|nr:hypothetical protein FGRA07_11123 [Fusarium graminearum]
MEPVKQSDLKGLVDRGSILMLDVTIWGLSFVYETIYRNPSHISTKTGNITLPTEMWLEIISHVKLDTDEHVYKAVHPVDIQAAQTDDSNPEPSLICNSIKIGTLCGDLDSEHRVHEFNEYLNNPLAKEEERHMWRPETTPPFKILDATKDPIYSIPLHHSETDIEFLFHEIQPNMSPLITDKPLLGPLLGLNAWTFAMEALLYIRRTPALSKYNVSFDPAIVKKEKAEKLPPYVQWPADNFNNLLEQPTQFYAVLLGLTFLGVKDKITVRMAWGYVGLRFLHSMIHVTTNNVLLRFPAFAASSVVLLGLTAKAAWELLF